MSKEAAIKAVGIILSCYPSANREGIENFYKLAVESLSEFPPEILEFLSHPKVGIASSSTFLPSIAEMRKFCHAEWEKRRRYASWDSQSEAKRLHAPDPLPEYSAEHRAMMLQKFRDLSKELGGKDKEPTMTREEYQAKLEANLERMAEEAKTTPPPPLSPTLRKILNLP